MLRILYALERKRSDGRRKKKGKKRTLERVQGVLQGKMHFFLFSFILVVITISCYSLHIFLNFSQIHISKNIKINFI